MRLLSFIKERVRWKKRDCFGCSTLQHPMLLVRIENDGQRSLWSLMFYILQSDPLSLKDRV